MSQFGIFGSSFRQVVQSEQVKPSLQSHNLPQCKLLTQNTIELRRS
jgi:hypothetical protein